METKMRIYIRDNEIINGFDEKQVQKSKFAVSFRHQVSKSRLTKNVYDYKMVRVGTPGDDKLRAIKLCLDGEMKRILMRRKKLFNDFEEYREKVWINHDHTSKERHAKYLDRE